MNKKLCCINNGCVILPEIDTQTAMDNSAIDNKSQ